MTEQQISHKNRENIVQAQEGIRMIERGGAKVLTFEKRPG